MYLQALKLHGFKSFADPTILRFEPGVTAIVGPNGCGKSTLMNMIAGLTPVDEGEILFDGKSLRDTQIGYVFPGQTEFFAARWGGEPTMAFCGGRLRVALLSWHVPLREVPACLTAPNFTRAVRAADELARAEGVAAPRLAVCGFNPHAVSPKGARGLMQLMPSTANQLGVSNIFDPQANVTGGSRYLRELLERYNFDLVKALAAYNAGPLRVEQYQGVPPFRETRAYVARIVHEYNTKKIAQEKEAKKQVAAQSTNKASFHAHRAPKPTATAIAAQPPR